MNFFLSCLFLLGFAPQFLNPTLNAQFFLIEVQINPINLSRLQEKGIDIILDFEDLILVKGDEKTISLIEGEGIGYKILDKITEGYDYYIFWKPVSFFGGEMIVEREGYFLMKIREGTEFNDLRFYPRLPEGIYKIPLTPIPFRTDAKYLAPKFDTLIQQMVNKVSSDTIMTVVRRLQDFRTRYSSTDSARAAANFIRDKFLAYGLDSVYFQTFRSDFAPNVIGIKRGRLPESIYVVICGHFDSYSNINPQTTAPGADDNATGTAGLLEAARILKDYQFNHTIRFIAFSGEEEGLLGSFHYCSLARYLNRDSIIGAINCDMIGYTLPGRDSSSIIGKPANPNCAPLVDYFISCANLYTDLKCQRQVIDRPRSDHASFNRFGYLAIHIRENLNLSNPYYHTPGDTIGAGFNDLNFVTKVIKASLATVASLSEPYPVGIKEEKDFAVWFGKNPPQLKGDWYIYNIYGRLVKDFESFPSNRYPSGVYFLMSKNERKCQKLVRIR